MRTGIKCIVLYVINDESIGLINEALSENRVARSTVVKSVQIAGGALPQLARHPRPTRPLARRFLWCEGNHHVSAAGDIPGKPAQRVQRCQSQSSQKYGEPRGGDILIQQNVATSRGSTLPLIRHPNPSADAGLQMPPLRG